MWVQTPEGDEFVRDLSKQLVEQFAPEELEMFDVLALTFAFHWIVLRVYRRMRPVRCPSCGTFSAESEVVGKNCRRCGENMVPWLYVAS
jgi:hypothetical protein